MHSYAQTNVQLFNQLRSTGYSEKDRKRVREAYAVAMQLFAGLFLPSGKTFLDHLVGTASILASLHAPVEIVVAGLIHAAYLHGDFGFVKAGISRAKRARLQRSVGDEVEEYVAKYDRLLWTWENIQSVHENLDDLGPVERQVLLIRLANELEHQLDLGGIYFAESEKDQVDHQRSMQVYGPMLVRMADKIGFPALAAAMEPVFKDVISEQVPVVPWIQSKHRAAYLVAPKSYHEMFSIKFWRNLCNSYQFCFRNLNRVKLVRHKVYRRMQHLFRKRFRFTGQG